MIFRNWLASLRSASSTPRTASSRTHSRHQRLLTASAVEHLEPRTVLTTIDLANLGVAGTTIFGADPVDHSGFSVSSAGDMNGDGFDDLLIGAYTAAAAGNLKANAGESYVIFGGTSLPATIDLASLGAAGIKIFGAEVGDRSGRSVSKAGDVNGDGFDDLLIGSDAYGVGNTRPGSGESYLIFGGALLPATIDLANLGGSGITIVGADQVDLSGRSVSNAGDVNGDGFDDILIGAHYADSAGNSKPNAGESYLIFGGTSFPTTIDFANLGAAGVTIFGADENDLSGISVSNAGDVNGDGFDDVLIGAYGADASENGKPDAGESYLIFGSGSLPSILDLGNLNGASIRILGAGTNDRTGVSVSRAGDVNGDGFDDLLIGASQAAAFAGESYVIFGSASLLSTIDLANLGSSGITIFGVDPFDQSGLSVSGAGDMNGDGFDDLLIGAIGAGVSRESEGVSYVVFGRSSFPTSLSLADLGTGGITALGVDPMDQSGNSVSNAGDVNGDGFDDLLIGAWQAASIGNSTWSAGESYLIFGGDGFTSSVTHLGTAVGETLVGDSGADVINGAAGGDTLIGNGGADVIYGGEGGDVVAVSDLTFQRVDGGNGLDTLRLDGAGIALNLTTLADNKLTSIETIDLRGSGANSLTLNMLELLNLTSGSNPARTANVLTVRRDSNDAINMGSGWTQGSEADVEGIKFQTFSQGAATLRVEVPALVAVSLVSGQIVVTSPAYMSVDVVVSRDSGTQEIVVDSRASNGLATAYRFPIASVTNGLNAILSPQADRFDASLAGLPVTVNGGDGDDSLAGGTANDQLIGGIGNDTLTGGLGQDTLDAGAGGLDLLRENFDADLTVSPSQLTAIDGGSTVVDSLSGFEKALILGGGSANRLDASLSGIPVTMFGGSGNDVLIGGTQADSLDGQGGNDTLTGSGGADALGGGPGNDLLREAFDQNLTLTDTTLLAAGNGGESVTDSLTAFEHAELSGGTSRNRIDLSRFTASLGATINGSGQSDTIFGSPGPDLITTLTGADVISGLGGADVVYAGSGNDTISGGDGADNLSGQNGNDLVQGEAGNDVLVGGAGIDTLNGGADNDFLSGQTDAGLLNGDDGNDSLLGNTASDTLNGDAGDDRLISLQGNDVLNGDVGADTLFAGSGNDSLNGGAGADDLRGEVGSDTINGGADADRINEVFDVNLTITGQNIATAGLGSDVVTNVERINILGGASANFFDARNANIFTLLIGDLGNDTLMGGSRSDILNGGDGDDVLSGGASNDAIDGGAGFDYFYEKADTDFTAFGLTLNSAITGDDTPRNVECFVLIGGSGANMLDASIVFLPVVLIGGSGNDTLLGGPHADFLIGGNRNDSTVPGSDGIDSLVGNGGDALEDDPADIKVITEFDTTVSNAFALLPSWIDAL